MTFKILLKFVAHVSFSIALLFANHLMSIIQKHLFFFNAFIFKIRNLTSLNSKLKDEKGFQKKATPPQRTHTYCYPSLPAKGAPIQADNNPVAAGRSIPDKSSEVGAVKRLLTSHFISQTFRWLFVLHCTPSARAAATPVLGPSQRPLTHFWWPHWPATTRRTLSHKSVAPRDAS